MSEPFFLTFSRNIWNIGASELLEPAKTNYIPALYASQIFSLSDTSPLSWGLLCSKFFGLFFDSPLRWHRLCSWHMAGNCPLDCGLVRCSGCLLRWPCCSSLRNSATANVAVVAARWSTSMLWTLWMRTTLSMNPLYFRTSEKAAIKSSALSV